MAKLNRTTISRRTVERLEADSSPRYREFLTQQEKFLHLRAGPAAQLYLLQPLA